MEKENGDIAGPSGNARTGAAGCIRGRHGPAAQAAPHCRGTPSRCLCGSAIYFGNAEERAFPSSTTGLAHGGRQRHFSRYRPRPLVDSLARAAGATCRRFPLRTRQGVSLVAGTIFAPRAWTRTQSLFPQGIRAPRIRSGGTKSITATSRGRIRSHHSTRTRDSAAATTRATRRHTAGSSRAPGLPRQEGGWRSCPRETWCCCSGVQTGQGRQTGCGGKSRSIRFFGKGKNAGKTRTPSGTKTRGCQSPDAIHAFRPRRRRLGRKEKARAQTRRKRDKSTREGRHRRKEETRAQTRGERIENAGEEHCSGRNRTRQKAIMPDRPRARHPEERA